MLLLTDPSLYLLGGCRQKIAEFADPDVIVTLSNLAGDEEKFTVKDLLRSIHKRSYGLRIATERNNILC